MNFATSFLEVLAAMMASTAVGFWWYSPMAFAKPWMTLMGYTKESLDKAKKTMGPKYGLTMLVGLLQAFVLAMITRAIGANGIIGHLIIAGWMWIGFVMPTQLTAWIFGGKQFKLFLIDTGYQFASLLVMAVVLGLL